MMDLSVLIPIYNSERIIYPHYEKINQHLQGMGITYELLMRDDKSGDASLKILEKISKENKHVKVFYSQINHGLGYNLKELIRFSKGRFICYLDIDLSYGVEGISKLFNLINQEKQDIVLASKYLGERRSIPFKRIIASRVYYLINRFLFGIRLRDIGSGMVLFDRRILDKIVLNSDDFNIHLELFWKAKRSQFKIKEVGLPYVHYNQGSFKLLKHGPRTLLSTLLFWLRENW